MVSYFLTAATGVTATTGDITASTGDIVASVGNLVAVDGNLVLTSGLISLGASFGSSGDVLTSQGNVTAPIWAPATGGGGFTWQAAAGTTVAMAKNNGYITESATLYTFTLPSGATTNIGDVFAVSSSGLYADSWRINVTGLSDSIRIGNAQTSGGTGYLASTAVGDVVTMVCTVKIGTDLVYTVISSMGNITVV